MIPAKHAGEEEEEEEEEERKAAGRKRGPSRMKIRVRGGSCTHAGVETVD